MRIHRLVGTNSNSSRRSNQLSEEVSVGTKKCWHKGVSALMSAGVKGDSSRFDWRLLSLFACIEAPCAIGLDGYAGCMDAAALGFTKVLAAEKLLLAEEFGRNVLDRFCSLTCSRMLERIGVNKSRCKHRALTTLPQTQRLDCKLAAQPQCTAVAKSVGLARTVAAWVVP